MSVVTTSGAFRPLISSTLISSALISSTHSSYALNAHFEHSPRAQYTNSALLELAIPDMNALLVKINGQDRALTVHRVRHPQ